jgi:hypothetical protein
MKRRCFALLAVPALALGFTFASPGTDEAHAAYWSPWTGYWLICTMYDMHYARAVDNGDETTSEQIYAQAEAAGC